MLIGMSTVTVASMIWTYGTTAGANNGADTIESAATPITTTEATSHLSCWCSTARERRYRATSDAAARSEAGDAGAFVAGGGGEARGGEAKWVFVPPRRRGAGAEAPRERASANE